ncbi:phosphotransferase [Paenibacillus aceris]|uniref:Aminoglycoside phosphotransferase (APT) family kinase protein n=1 Tax=Paenibacillus aceris TaxID=869555 RepID=A0ABS4I0W7_9BACL|nr:phosphotransferase [Paenibacillus aceris]MBP1964563.1 aminoglycoside phosphotransferase (APT) family kinase protein [Paenibacillus aceris]NHW35728.1 phosphotransferase [Paenibacillus aceris]
MDISNLWDAEWEVSEELARKLISSQFPSLMSAPIKRLGYGWDNTVFLVGEDYVFRFPRRKVAIDLLRMEAKILPKLADFVTLPYSKPLFFGEGNLEYPAPFLGYPYLSGKFPIGLTDEQRQLSTSLLAQFLKRLHAFPVQIAQENGIQRDHRNLTDLTERKEKMLKFLSDLSPHLKREEHRAILDYLEQHTTDRVQQRYVFLHGDLHFKNILVNKRGEVSGIIDWGDMNLGHPACDLNVAYSFLPPHARSDFFREYGEVDEETKVLARMIAVYIPMLILMQAIDEKDNEVAVEAKAIIARALADV